MKALLLAAGKASRLGSLSQDTPKCLHKIGGTPLIDRLVEQLMSVGVNEFLINTHHLADRVEAHVRAAPWGERATISHEEVLLGTLATLRVNQSFFGLEPGWVLHADNYISDSLHPVSEAFETRPNDIWGCMLTFKVDSPDQYGVIEQDGSGVVNSFFEKSPGAASLTASAATFLFDVRAIQLACALPSTATDISRHLMPRLLGKIIGVPATGEVIDIGTPSGLESARARALEAGLRHVTGS